MKKYGIYITIMCTIGFAANVSAQTVHGVTVKDVHTECDGNNLKLSMNLNLSALQVDGNRAVLLTPQVVTRGDTTNLKSIGVYGRKRYYHYVRSGESLLTDEREMSFKARQKPESLAYSDEVAYKGRLDSTQILLRRTDYGCCETCLGSEMATLVKCSDSPMPIPPSPAEPKTWRTRVSTDTLTSDVCITFPINITSYHNGYRTNAEAMKKLAKTIITSYSDSSVTVLAVRIKSYASPEGLHKNNAALAKGRAETLKSILSDTDVFHDSKITTETVAEDWEGVRSYVSKSDLSERNEILTLIDSSTEPDTKEKALQTKFPTAYKQIKSDCYPALRRAECTITYVKRTVE